MLPILLNSEILLNLLKMENIKKLWISIKVNIIIFINKLIKNMYSFKKNPVLIGFNF